MTTKQNDAKQMANRELDQVNGGMYLPGYDGPIRPLAFVMKRRSNRTFSYTECDEKGGSKGGS